MNQQQRICSGCNFYGHNIRTCVKNLEDSIIAEYERMVLINSPTTFPEIFIPNMNTNTINKLCQKHGLAIIDLTNIQKLERLHRIYLHLGRQQRLNQISTSFQEIRERIDRRNRNIPMIYRPSYLEPISPEEQQNQILYDIDNMSVLVSQMMQLRGLMNVNINKKKIPTIQIILDKSKFVTNNHVDVGECPICYENCSNLVSTNCNHLYCQSCVLNVINTVNKTTLPCPLCRENVNNIYVFSESSSELMMNL